MKFITSPLHSVQLQSLSTFSGADWQSLSTLISISSSQPQASQHSPICWACSQSAQSCGRQPIQSQAVEGMTQSCDNLLRRSDLLDQISWIRSPRALRSGALLKDFQSTSSMEEPAGTSSRAGISLSAPVSIQGGALTPQVSRCRCAERYVDAVMLHAASPSQQQSLCKTFGKDRMKR